MNSTEGIALAKENNNPPNSLLTEQELDWLSSHPDIRFGFPGNVPPYSKLTSKGEYEGYIHDWYAAINQQLGTNIAIVPHDLNTLDQALASGIVDGIAAVIYSKRIKNDDLYTDLLIEAKWSVFTSRSTIPYSSFAQVSHKEIGVLEGSYANQQLSILFPSMKLKSYSSFLAATKGIEKGEIFAVLGESRIINNFIKMENIYSVKENFVADDLVVRTGTKIRKDWKILADIINKAQQAIPFAKRQLIWRKWLVPELQLSHLSYKDIDWLQKKQFIDINFYQIPPYLLDNNGKVDGFLVDYFSLYERMLGFKFNIRLIPFSQYPLNKDGSLPDASFTLPKKKYADRYDYTKPFFHSSYGLFTRVDHPKISSLENLGKHTIGLIQAAQPGDRSKFLTRNSNVQIKNYSDFDSMINALLLKEIDSVFSEASVMRSYLSSNMIQTISLNWLDTQNIVAQSMAIRKDLSPLVGILSSSWNEMNHHAISQVFQKWIVSDYHSALSTDVKNIIYTADEKNGSPSTLWFSIAI